MVAAVIFVEHCWVSSATGRWTGRTVSASGQCCRVAVVHFSTGRWRECMTGRTETWSPVMNGEWPERVFAERTRPVMSDLTHMRVRSAQTAIFCCCTILACIVVTSTSSRVQLRVRSCHQLVVLFSFSNSTRFYHSYYCCLHPFTCLVISNNLLCRLISFTIVKLCSLKWFE